MPKPDWIIFDVGGVLLDWRRSAQSLASYLGVDANKLLAILFKHAPQMNIGKVSAQEGWSRILQELGIDKLPRDIITRWRASEFWFDDSLKLLEELDAQDYNLAIFSNSWLGLTEKEARETFPAQIKLFKHIFDSSRDGMAKPALQYYELVKNKLNPSGQKILLIDDDDKNLIPANSKGWQTFHYESGDGKELDSNTKLRNLLLN